MAVRVIIQRWVRYGREAELRRALEITLSMVKQPSVLLDGELKIRTINAAFIDAFDLSEKDAQSNKSLFELADGRFDVPNLPDQEEEYTLVALQQPCP